jgi:hypothetical protein
MKASHSYGACTICGEEIKKGDEFKITDGEFSHAKCEQKAEAAAVAEAQGSRPKPRKKSPAAKAPAAPKAPKAPAKPKPKPKKKAEPKPKESKVEKVNAKGESACGMILRMLCEKKHTDEEILKAVTAVSSRPEKSLKAAISVNRSELNRGNFPRVRERYGVGDKDVIVKLARSGKEIMAASEVKVSEVPQKPKPKKRLTQLTKGAGKK